MKLGKVLSPDFQSTLGDLMYSPMPIKTAFKLKEISKRIKSALDQYEVKRQEALNLFGTKNEQGALEVGEDGQVKLEGENLSAFAAQLTELMNINILFAPISIDELDESFKISAQDLMVLDGVII